MKVFGINSSARKDGNTAVLMNKVLDALNKTGIETKNREALANMENLGQSMAYLFTALV